MLFQGIFTVSEEKNEVYNRMHNQIVNASRLDAKLAAKMSAKFAELRRVNREWDHLLDELAQSVTGECARRRNEHLKFSVTSTATR